MKLVVVLALLGILVKDCACVLPVMTNIHSKFEYKQGFKGPHMVDSKGNIPFWTHGGSAIPSDEYIRVCPSMKSHRGWVWSKHPLETNHWFIDVSVRVTGRLKKGADGMAIWVTDGPGSEGFIYGSSDRWKGVGLFLDSFDNDAQGDNPKVQVVLNDGTISYDHRSDGSPQESGHCLKDFRNRPYTVKIRMSFIRGILEVWVHEGLSIADDDYELCMRIENEPRLSSIPKRLHFGVSAATGGLSDDHDVVKFLTYSVQTYEERAVQEIMDNSTAYQDMTQKYSQLSGEFDKKRETYFKEHPDSMAGSDWRRETEGVMDWQKKMELEQSVQTVADMQLALQREIRGLSRKMDILISQEMGGQGSAPSAVPGSLASDLTQIRNTESNILHQLADLRAAMDRSVPEGTKVTASEQLQPLYDIKNSMSQQTLQLEAVNQHLQGLSQNRCPPAAEPTSTSCLSSWLFAVVMVIQTVVFIGYSLYSQAQERRAKKFF